VADLGNSASNASSRDHPEAMPSEHVHTASKVAKHGFTISTRSGEIVRLLIVVLLFTVFGITLVWAFIAANGKYWNNVKDLLDLVLPAETALLGTTIAFYMTNPGKGDDDGSNR
jgi:hypothetical protein